jgi:hypothetical protein
MKHLFAEALLPAMESGIVETPKTEEEEHVHLRGPLANIFAEMLNKVYSKEEPKEGEAMESLQMDTALAQKLNSMVNQNSAPTDNFQTIYGVSRDNVSSDTVVDLSKELVGAQNGSDFFLVVDGTKPGDNSAFASAPVDTISSLDASGQSARNITAMECLVEAHGGKVIYWN